MARQNKRPRCVGMSPEPLEPRRFLSATPAATTTPSSVQGTLYHDANENGAREAAEPGLPGWTVYIDANADGALNPGEPSTLTDRSGLYTLPVATPGDVAVRIIPQPLWAPPPARTVNITTAYNVTGLDIPLTSPILSGNPVAAGPLATQTGSGGDPQVAVDGQGRSILAWCAGGTVYFRRSARDAATLAPATVVATDPQPRAVRVTASAAGDFIVYWESVPSGSAFATYARRYDSTGQPLGPTFKVAGVAGAIRPAVSIAILQAGGYVVARGASGGLIYVERYSAAGALIGSPTPVEPATAGAGQATIAADDDGAFLVAWNQPDTTGSTNHDVYARLYNPDASPATDPFRVNSYADGDQTAPAPAAAGHGHFVVAWTGPHWGSTNLTEYVQRIAPTGPVGGETMVTDLNATTYTIAMAPSGEFTTAYSKSGIWAQHYSAAGVPSAPVRLFRSPYNDPIGNPGVAFDPDGDFVAAAYETNTPGFTTARGQLAQRFAVPPAAVPLDDRSLPPGRARLRFSELIPTPPTAQQLIVQNLDTGQVLDSTRYDWDFDPAASEAHFRLLGAGAAPPPDGNYRLTLPASAVTDAARNPMTADVSLDLFLLAGDITRDRVVNFSDLLVLAKNYNRTGVTFAGGDLDGNGTVNFGDLLILAKNYNRTLAPPPPPAPTLAAAAAAPTSLLHDNAPAAASLFSTTRSTKPAPAPLKLKTITRPKGR